MKRFFLKGQHICGVIVSLAILGGSGYAGILDEEISISRGEMAALQLNLYAPTVFRNIVEQYDAPMLARYNKAEGKIILILYGAQDKIGMAQATIKQLPDRLKYDFIPYLKDTYNIDLEMYYIKIIYRNRNEEGAKILLVWENGQFSFPEQ